MQVRHPALRTRIALALAVFSVAAACAWQPSAPEGGWRASVDPALGELDRGTVSLIVQKTETRDDSVERAVRRLGGTITRDLPIVDGFAARVPAGSIDNLAGTAGVRALTLDRAMYVQGTTSSSTKSVYTRAVRADKVWEAGVTGRGVAVALIDTGVNPVADLAGRIRPVYDDTRKTWSACQNLTGEPDCTDSFGHGTFIAGIIAGDGTLSGGRYTGVAPQADIVSVKIAGRNGAADVSSVLAAIQWVVSFRDRYGIRVINLSLGTDSTQTYRTDPLNYAVERAWASGIVVVVSASNRGPDAGTISKPGDDPWVITVGAVDDRGTPSVQDDALPNFSSRGPTAADGLPKPDVAAPGAHMVSLRAVGSAIDTEFPNYIDDHYRKGSGTSMSAGVVSGVVALMLQGSPDWTPDRVKYALRATARPAASPDPMAVGTGEVNAYGATFSAPDGMANQGLDRSSGMGSLDASRGTVRVQANDPWSTIVGGGLTLQLLLWDPAAYTSGEWSGASWYGASWYGASWYGASWYGSTWSGASWYGASWYGEPDGASWYGASWYGASWYGGWE